MSDKTCRRLFQAIAIKERLANALYYYFHTQTLTSFSIKIRNLLDIKLTITIINIDFFNTSSKLI